MNSCLQLSKAVLKICCFMVVILAMGVLVSTDVLASSAGTSSGLPYEGWLMTFQKSLTGPVAFSIALAGIIGCGASLVFLGGEMSRFLRSMVYILLVMTLIIGADTVMTNFFNAADIGIVSSESSPYDEPEEAIAQLSHELQTENSSTTLESK